MKNITLIIDAIRIPLADSLDVEALKRAIVVAARSGGDFVHLESEKGVHYDLLVTPASTVVVQSVSHVVEFAAAVSTWTASLDLEI